MNGNPSPSPASVPPPPPVPTNDELRIKQFEAEIESRERITKAAETEINRLWAAFMRISKIVLVLSTVCLFIFAVFGVKTYRDILNGAQYAAQLAVTSEITLIRTNVDLQMQTEMNNVRTQVQAQIEQQLSTPELQKIIADQIADQLSSPQLQKVFADKINARLDVSSVPLITSFLSNNAETWTKNYLENNRSESYSITNSDRVAILKFADGAIQVFIRLNNVPAANSVHVTQVVSAAHVPVASVSSQLNVLNIYFTPGAAAYLENSTFEIEYFSDKTQPYIVQHVDIRGKQVFYDNFHVKFPQNGD